MRRTVQQSNAFRNLGWIGTTGILVSTTFVMQTNVFAQDPHPIASNERNHSATFVDQRPFICDTATIEQDTSLDDIHVEGTRRAFAPQSGEGGFSISEMMSDVSDSVSGGWEVFKDFLPNTSKSPVLPPVQQGQNHNVTVVVDLDTLANVTFINGRWRTRRRPGMHQFLQDCRNAGAELILFSSKLNSQMGWSLMEKFDPEHCITYRFFEEYRRDVLSLERPIERMIIITSNPGEYYGEGVDEIVVSLPKWNGQSVDPSLINAGHLIIAGARTTDTRKLVKSVSKKN